MIIRISALLLTAIIFLIPACNNSNHKNVFSKEETDWIKKNKTIQLSVDNSNIPLNYKNSEGELVGYNIDLVKLLAKKTNLEIQFIDSDWNTAYSRAISYEVDGVINIDSTEKRKEYLLFTNGFFNSPKTLLCKGSFGKRAELSNFKNYKLAAKLNTIHSEMLYKNLPDSNVFVFNNLSDAVILLKEGKIDGIFDDFSPLGYWMNKMQLEDVYIGYIETTTRQASIGIRKDKAIIFSILNKGISLITTEEKNELMNKWLQKEIHHY